jgi:hypothetical protein
MVSARSVSEDIVRRDVVMAISASDKQVWDKNGLAMERDRTELLMSGLLGFSSSLGVIGRRFRRGERDIISKGDFLLLLTGVFTL